MCLLHQDLLMLSMQYDSVYCTIKFGVDNECELISCHNYNISGTNWKFNLPLLKITNTWKCTGYITILKKEKRTKKKRKNNKYWFILMTDHSSGSKLKSWKRKSQLQQEIIFREYMIGPQLLHVVKVMFSGCFHK